MASKIGLNQALVDQARASASHIADDMQGFIDEHTTVTVERTVCRLLGIDGVNEVEVPMPNIVVDHLQEKGLTSKGVAWWIGNAVCATGLTPQAIAEGISKGEIDLSTLAVHTDAEVKAAIAPIARKMCERIKKNRATRDSMSIPISLPRAMTASARTAPASSGFVALRPRAWQISRYF